MDDDDEGREILHNIPGRVGEGLGGEMLPTWASGGRVNSERSRCALPWPLFGGCVKEAALIERPKSRCLART